MAKPVGQYLDARGRACCRATGKRCLTYRQAKASVRRAKAMGHVANAYRCRPCCAWHWGHDSYGPLRKPRRRRARVRR